MTRLKAAFSGLDVLPVSILDEASLDTLRDRIWRLTGLIRVYLRSNGTTDSEPLALDPGATVGDVATAVHHELGEAMTGARVWGPSARFDGQRVGRHHAVLDGDLVEVIS